jgi:hypothetical protein
MHDSHNCSSLHGNLRFFCLLTIRFTHYLISTFSLLDVSGNIFHNQFFIFHLDKQHPFWLERLPVSVELRIASSPVFKSPMSSCTPMWVWVYSRGPPFPYLAWCIQLSCGLSTCRWMPGPAWPYFPGLKVGQMYVSLFFFWWGYLVALIINRYVLSHGVFLFLS